MENILSKQFEKQYDMMLEWVDGFLNSLSDDDFKTELAPGKNHGVWLFGHIIVCDDDFSVYMGKGELLYPEIAEVFAQGSKLMPVEKYPPVKELKDQWKKVCEKNKKIYSELIDKELSEPHAMVKDFETDYFKTKERVVIAWQFHQVYHAGQLGVLVSKAGKNRF